MPNRLWKIAVFVEVHFQLHRVYEYEVNDKMFGEHNGGNQR